MDLFFILKSYHTLEQISYKAEELYDDLFAPKLLRQQLSYFNAIDNSEEIEFLGEPVSEDEIKNFLIEVAQKSFRSPPLLMTVN